MLDGTIGDHDLEASSGKMSSGAILTVKHDAGVEVTAAGYRRWCEVDAMQGPAPRNLALDPD